MSQFTTGSSADLVSLVSSNASTTVYPSDDAVLALLQQRFRSDQPYTRLASSTLVVVNPLRMLANLNEASAEAYALKCYADTKWDQEKRTSPIDVLPPHPYELAARAYHAMRRTKKSQAIVYSGATESGKSFTSKLVTSQLLRLSASATKRERKLAEQVKNFDTVLTAFGYAKTRSNANASRFSRYSELHYTTEGRLCGAQVFTFGLDKRRMHRLASEERTFHVFYQILAGATAEERDALRLDDVTTYDLLASSGCYRLPGGPSSDDSIMLDELRAAMKQLGFKSKHMTSIFTLLSAILLLGNLAFSDHNGTDASFEAAHITNPDVLADAADLLCVDADALRQALTHRSRLVKRELVTSLLNAHAAAAQRDALMRDLYATLFAFIVETANHKVAPTAASAATGASAAAPPAAEATATLIVQLDTPGYQSRAGSSVSGPAAAAGSASSQGLPSQHEEFCTNLLAEIVQNWQTRRVFDDALPPNAAILADGVPLPPIIPGGGADNTACVELLRGSSAIGASVVDRKPAGILGAMDKAVHRVRAGKMTEEADAALLVELDTFAVHAAYVSSHALYAHSNADPQLGAGRGRFGVQHYQGDTTYTSEHLVEHEVDAFDAQFVSLLRDSADAFVAKLFAGPSLATEQHPLDPSVIASAQVTVRPLRKITQLDNPRAASTEPLLDPTKMYGVTRQLNATLSEMLGAIDRAAAGLGQVWSVLCIRPNDISQANSFDVRRVRSQVRALLLPDLIARRRAEFVATYTHGDFCLRYAELVVPIAIATGADDAKGKIQAVAIANAWREGQDYAIGGSNVWLSYAVWRKMEDRMRATEVDMYSYHPPSAGAGAGDEARSPSLYPPGSGKTSRMPSFNSSSSNDANDKNGLRNLRVDDLPRQLSNSSDPFRSPADGPGGKGEDQAFWGAAGVAGAGGEWERQAYGDVNPGMAGALEKEGDLKAKPLDAIEEEGGVTSVRKWWKRIVWTLTWWIPSFLLSSCGRMKRPDVRFAWREKTAICLLILLFNGIILFYIIAFGRILCPDQNIAWNEQQLSAYELPDKFYVAVAGSVYDISKFWRGSHSDYASNFALTDQDTLSMFAGKDLTLFFPVPLSVGCAGLVTDNTMQLQNNPNNTNIINVVPGQAVHTSGNLQQDKTSKLAKDSWYPDRFLPFMRKYYKGHYVYSKKKIAEQGSYKYWVIANQNVYDLTDYFYTISYTPQSTLYSFLDKDLTDLFRTQRGSDVSSDFNFILASMNSTTRSANMACLNNNFLVGKVDYRETPRCQVQNYLLLAFSAILVATILAKFLAALQLTPKRNPEQQDKFVICQVPCYTEGEESLRKTIDSLAGLKYDDKRKLIFVICDGMIVGSGNELPTPRIVLDILGVDPRIDPEPLMFKSIADGSKQLNYGKVYSGLYEFEGHVVPYIVVVKCGRPSERARPGNRGKRDTQIMMMRWLNHVHFDAPMSPLELEITHQCKNVIGIDPAFYEYVLTVDADTSVEEDSLNRLVAVAADDSRIIALCGETKLDNEEGSWWTMIQVYEYFISHNLAKAFESLFGSVTCLPGCFSLYRVRSADKGRPLFVSSRIIDDYSENKVDTLHKKNLLSLGEDRYLTTLLLKHFPAFRTKFTADAHSHTSAPDRWGILLSQRRRWINSTVHNLAELMLMAELCGFCFFSMRFIVFIDLLGTIAAPATVIYLIYLIVEVTTGNGPLPIISIVMIGAVYGLQAFIFLLKRQWQYIGWMVIYILAYPVWSFFLPMYSFWHMDDFSWGTTRIVVGEKGNKKIVAGTDDEPYHDSMIPLKKFSEYQQEVWDKGSTRTGITSASGSPFANPPRMPGSTPGSVYKGSHYSPSPAGSDYGGDFFQNTNVLSHSRQGSNPNSLHTGTMAPSRMPSMGFGAPTTPGTPFASMYALPMQGSMYGVPSGPMASMYGMPSMYSMPAGPAPSALGMQPVSQDLGAALAPSRPQSTFNPFASPAVPLPPSASTDPSDIEITQAVRTYLAAQPSLMNVTKRSAREAVIASFPNAPSIADRKVLINKAIDDTLRGDA
ncbi:glycosyltransferase family 2 protein [Tilletiaria anomala UBC 951]|uniref:chitin synthase n=1 Tax=Tilletiaria anomala (strain ATCC 24038 / CBS 436.72 / UBC 951) TaxID=1037660 RepID=A0A066VQA1_TILAU|nr:glycosyltransferase family 2 protein [Tilletiaria anomala UBC 951]KDN43897.1 glycosyltransferase family 2 protein [Tilletiaria anomala UBC 951]